MSKKNKLFLIIAVFIGLGLLTTLGLKLRTADVLNPKGVIAQQQFELLLFGVALMLVIVVPVFIMTFMIVYKYREKNTSAKKYEPNWDHSRLFESIWWGFPTLIILILSIVTWQTSHSLDPFKPLKGEKTLVVQVVALQWKWLFIYPEQKIATLGYVKMPVDQPVQFQLTSDAPMNAFWIPQLGGQMYAMSGMATQINLEASQTGTFEGRSSNISGRGFSDMSFKAQAVAAETFSAWAKSTRRSSGSLDIATYNQLAKPSRLPHPASYSLSDQDLFAAVIAKYHAPNEHTLGNTEHSHY